MRNREQFTGHFPAGEPRSFGHPGKQQFSMRLYSKLLPVRSSMGEPINSSARLGSRWYKKVSAGHSWHEIVDGSYVRNCWWPRVCLPGMKMWATTMTVTTIWLILSQSSHQPTTTNTIGTARGPGQNKSQGILSDDDNNNNIRTRDDHSNHKE